ncbi:MAG: multidrug MFS transporter [Chlamydiae bacterium]|nr:multidrug MFS transporter [Chlamydiota bacterium]MBI3267048.1 multidrug MFS transporter [Chlamydiota bacterium]
MNIKMDFRENDAGIGDILTKKYDVTLTTEPLKTGDYIVNGEIVVERKTTLDFVQSIIDGRLFKQMARMKQFFDCAAVIIEGKDLYSTSVNIHPHAVKGGVISVALAWQVPVLFSDDKEDTALLLWLLGSQNEMMSHELSYRPGGRPKRILKKQLYILQGLPQVGPVLSNQLLTHFGTVEKVITASEEELMQVPRLGKVKAKTIRELVSK